MKCIICQKEFIKSNHLKIHINKHHNINEIENEINYLKSINPNLEIDLDDIIKMYSDGYSVNDLKVRYGIDIRNYIKLIGIARSNSESKKTKIYENKVKTTLIKKYGVDNLSKSKQIKQKKKETFMKNFGYENNFCNVEIRSSAISKIDYNKVKESNIASLAKKYGNHITNVAQLEYVREKISNTQKARFSNMSADELRKITEAARAAVKYTSSQEIRIQSILNEMGISYTANGFLYAYNWDFIFKNKVIIEVQGDFWHGNPKRYKKGDILLNGLTVDMVWNKDYRKKKKVENYGYRVYYLWETDINNMDDCELKETLIKMLC
jgi:G:T-mismatch repair DNA endonuclease (very short patch repair protein)